MLSVFGLLCNALRMLPTGRRHDARLSCKYVRVYILMFLALTGIRC